MIDVCIHDTVGMPMNVRKPLGGSEMALSLLGHGLERAGLSVHFGAVDCRVLILSRYSPRPNVHADKIVVSATDVYDSRYDPHSALLHVCVSRWQAESFAARGFVTRVIPPILSDHVYALWGTQKTPGRYIYASGVGKGLIATLDAWNRNPLGDLVVTTTGYDEPNQEIVRAAGARWIGLKNPDELATEIARSWGMFYVNVAPETFGVTACIAHTLGLEMLVRCEGHPPCGLREAMTDADRSAKSILPKWIEVLGL